MPNNQKTSRPDFKPVLAGILLILLGIKLTFAGCSCIHFHSPENGEISFENSCAHTENATGSEHNSEFSAKSANKNFFPSISSIDSLSADDTMHCYNCWCTQNQYLSRIEVKIPAPPLKFSVFGSPSETGFVCPPTSSLFHPPKSV